VGGYTCHTITATLNLSDSYKSTRKKTGYRAQIRRRKRLLAVYHGLVSKWWHPRKTVPSEYQRFLLRALLERSTAKDGVVYYILASAAGPNVKDARRV